MKIIRPELVLLLKDAYTKESPRLSYELSLHPSEGLHGQNTRGYHLFYHLPGRELLISVRSPYYLPLEKSLSLPAEEPLVFELWPREIYPFPKGATLILGCLKRRNGQEVPEAMVEIRTLFEEIKTRTDTKGCFVLFPRRVEGQRLIRQGNKLLLPGPRGGKRLPLKVKVPGLRPVTHRLIWPVGRVTKLEIEVG